MKFLAKACSLSLQQVSWAYGGDRHKSHVPTATQKQHLRKADDGPGAI
ncbi:hypothetical protein IMZ48_33885 [Candidatus Bathyarchaeota archaeon]|nr:hypothetical protein [Candidatus Bathyarchaeota archaeon]